MPEMAACTSPFRHSVRKNQTWMPGFARSSKELQKAWANRYLSEDVGNGVKGNGAYREVDVKKQPYQWFGRGLKQLTHRDNYIRFGSYLDRHPGLVAPFVGMSFEKAFADNPNELFDVSETGILDVSSSTLSARGRLLLAASAAWFWAESAKLNSVADQLKYDNADSCKHKTDPFYMITKIINGGQTGLSARFDAYQIMNEQSTEGANSYENIVSALSVLGIKASGAKGFESKFGIRLNKRTPVVFESLLSDSLPLSEKSPDLQFSQLAQAMAVPEESLEMFIDNPMIEFGSPMYMVAQRGSASSSAADRSQKMGVCAEYVENGTGVIRPVFDAKHYFREYKAGPNVVDSTNHIREDIVVSVDSQPSHGGVELSFPDAVNSSRYDFHYIPDKDYVGEDRFSFSVKVDGKVLRIYYQVKVFSSDENPNYVGFCNWKRSTWKISDANPVSVPLNIADGNPRVCKLNCVTDL